MPLLHAVHCQHARADAVDRLDPARLHLLTHNYCCGSFARSWWRNILNARRNAAREEQGSGITTPLGAEGVLVRLPGGGREDALSLQENLDTAHAMMRAAETLEARALMASLTSEVPIIHEWDGCGGEPRQMVEYDADLIDCPLPACRERVEAYRAERAAWAVEQAEREAARA